MTKSTRSSEPRLLPNWKQVLIACVVGIAWGMASGAYDRWKVRRDYDEHYSKMLELPRSIERPIASLHRMPGVVGEALWVSFYQPNASEDVKLRDWFVRHSAFSEFKNDYPRAPQPIGSWRSGRSGQYLVISRHDEDGWVHLSFGQEMPPDEAAKDLANFPWGDVRKG